ncbi:MAG: P-loop containing nucleoside triphosphate hydrolase protein [Linnemannia elongata]|nr:MAG: P-loop containing nucleoside triphosphate hydrolase protein [Linnemannia elongata]
MDWIASKTGTLLNSTVQVIDQVVQSGSRFEATLSPAAMKVVKGVMGNDVLSAGFFLMIIGSFYTFFKDLFVRYYYEIQSWFYVSVEVQEGDDTYKWLSEWVAERPLTKSVRHLTVKAVWDDDSDSDDYYSNNNSKDERPRLLFMPGMGSHVLYHKGYKVNVSRDRPDQASGADSEQSRILASIQKKQCLTISTFGWDISRLKTIVQDAMEESYKKKEGKTTIYTSQPYDNYWSGSSTRSPRAFHSVILAEGLKEELLEDITTFRNSSQWYHDRGVPYRRGYLLHGPPGTGKTSFIVALAGHLNMSVCIVNLGISGLNDQQLDRLLNNAPRNSILLMEDVDAALVKRKAGKAQEGGNNVTLSGILNALDGITAQEGSVVFMTTNHIRKLAPALIRPGRCDRKMLFDYADKHQIEGMFMKFFLSRPPVAPKPPRKSFVGSATTIAAAPAASLLDLDSKEKGRKEAYDDMIKRTAAKMTEAITFKDAVTTAQLQGFFMLHRDDPENILNEVPGFLAELAHEREVLSNKKVIRRQRREKKKAKKEEVEKKAKAAKIAAGETVDSSEDEDDEDDDESESDSFSDSDYYEEAKKPNGSASPKEIKSVNGVKAAGGEQEVPAQTEATVAAAI